MNVVLWVAVDNKNHSESYLEIKKREHRVIGTILENKS